MDEYEQQTTAAMFGLSVRQARERRGWSQSELARRMNDAGWPKYSQVGVSRTEDGTRAVRLDEALTLASVLGVHLEDLLVLGHEEQDLKQTMDLYAASGDALESEVDRTDAMGKALRTDIEMSKLSLRDDGLSDVAKARLERLIESAEDLLVGDLLYFVNRALIPKGYMFPYADRTPASNLAAAMDKAGVDSGEHPEAS